MYVMAQWDELLLKHNSYFQGPTLSQNIFSVPQE